MNTLDVVRDQESEKWWNIIGKDVEKIDDLTLRAIIEMAFSKIFSIVYSKGYTLTKRK